MSKRLSIPLQADRGMYSAGDAGADPRGTVRVLENYLPRPNRLPARPPFTYDTVMNVNGLVNFDDPTNKVSRLVSVDSTAHVRTKSATMGSETWGSANATTISGTRVTDFCNYRGTTYAMVDNGSGLPSAAFSYDGTNINTSPFNSTIAGRTITTVNDRNFIAYPRVTFTVNNGADAGYNVSNAASYTAAGLTMSDVVVSGGTIRRAYLTSTTAASIAWSKAPGGIEVGLGSYAASKSPQYGVAQWGIRTLDSLNDLPVTLIARCFIGWHANTVYAAGDIITGNIRLQRCTVGGTSGGVAPTWATTVGTTTTDNTVTWICAAATDYYGATETSVPNATATSGTTIVTVPFVVPPATNTQLVAVTLLFHNTANPTITLTAVDLSFVDGLTDGDPRKANSGLQVTTGDFYFPFYNQESSTTATIDLPSIVWSEIKDPKRIRAANTYSITEFFGYPTAAVGPISGRYLVFGRNGFIFFQGTSDPDIPIRRERYDSNIGCLGPRALDVYEDEVFFIGENEVYRMKVGGLPTPICGEGMREEIMSKSTATWVEAQSTYKRPILAIDKTKLIVWMYTQKSKLYAYDLRTQVWSRHTCPTTSEVDAMLWNSNTGNFYVAFSSATYGLARMDYTQAANDTIDNTVNTYSVDKTITFTPIELYDPPRFDATLEEIRLMHAATASQSGQTCTAYYSFDQGATYPKSTAKTISPLSTAGEFLPLPFEAYQTAPSITVKVIHSGKAGETAWSISPRVYAEINVRRGEYVTTNPTAGAASL